jgi:hypothetical protein
LIATVDVAVGIKQFETGGMAPRAVPAPDDREHEIVSYADQLIRANRQEMRRADAKSVQAIAAAGSGAITLSAAIADGTLALSEISTCQLWTWWTGCALWVASVTLLVLAMVPRLGGNSPAGHIAYFGDVRRLAESGALRAALEETAREPLGTVIAELAWTSVTVMTKYRLVRYGIGSLAGAAVLLIGSMV